MEPSLLRKGMAWVSGRGPGPQIGGGKRGRVMGGVLLEPKEDRVGASLRVQIWVLSFGKAWDRRIMGAPTGLMVVSQGRRPSSITLGESWGTCVEVPQARTILLADDHLGVTGEVKELTKD